VGLAQLVSSRLAWYSRSITSVTASPSYFRLDTSESQTVKKEGSGSWYMYMSMYFALIMRFT